MDKKQKQLADFIRKCDSEVRAELDKPQADRVYTYLEIYHPATGRDFYAFLSETLRDHIVKTHRRRSYEGVRYELEALTESEFFDYCAGVSCGCDVCWDLADAGKPVDEEHYAKLEMAELRKSADTNWQELMRHRAALSGTLGRFNFQGDTRSRARVIRVPEEIQTAIGVWK